MQRRSVAQAKHVCVVTDGAEWCQAFADRHRPDTVRILDFPHAAEHLSTLLEACGQAGVQLPNQMLSRCLQHEALRKLPRAPITCPHSHRPLSPPFVKKCADRCPYGTPVVVASGRGHRPRLYCSDRCRQRAYRWRHAGITDLQRADSQVASQTSRSRHV